MGGGAPAAGSSSASSSTFSSTLGGELRLFGVPFISRTTRDHAAPREVAPVIRPPQFQPVFVVSVRSRARAQEVNTAVLPECAAPRSRRSPPSSPGDHSKQRTGRHAGHGYNASKFLTARSAGRTRPRAPGRPPTPIAISTAGGPNDPELPDLLAAGIQNQNEGTPP